MIQAAIERSKLKRAGVTPQNVENLPVQTLKKIEEIEARRAQLKQAMEKQSDIPYTQPVATPMCKTAKEYCIRLKIQAYFQLVSRRCSGSNIKI